MRDFLHSIHLFKPSFITAINHLLKREAWARARLQVHQNQKAQLLILPWKFKVRVTSEGLLEALHSEAAAPLSDTALPLNDAAMSLSDDAFSFDVTITVPIAALSYLATEGQSGLMKRARIEGDVEFAQTLAFLAQHLRWEIEEDLSYFIGDMGAEALVNSVKSFINKTQSGI